MLTETTGRLQFVSARESSLFIFHALGKVLYSKSTFDLLCIGFALIFPRRMGSRRKGGQEGSEPYRNRARTRTRSTASTFEAIPTKAEQGQSRGTSILLARSTQADVDRRCCSRKHQSIRTFSSRTFITTTLRSQTRLRNAPISSMGCLSPMHSCEWMETTSVRLFHFSEHC